MAFTKQLRIYLGQEITVFIINGQPYADANELLACADTTIERYLSDASNADNLDDFERMAVAVLTVLNPRGIPFFISHPERPKSTLLSRVAAYHILSQMGEDNLNRWLQNELSLISKSLT